MIDFLNVKRISKPADMGELMEVRIAIVMEFTNGSEYDIILDIMLRISMSLVICTYFSAVVVSMLAIYALITNPLLLFVMVASPRIMS